MPDAVIGHFFTEVVPLDLERHLPRITDFWEAVVFNRHSYSKNVMEVHLQIHRLSPIDPAHLRRWVTLFTQTVEEHFEGERATLAIQRALSIATLMQLKTGNHPPINKLP